MLVTPPDLNSPIDAALVWWLIDAACAIYVVVHAIRARVSMAYIFLWGARRHSDSQKHYADSFALGRTETHRFSESQNRHQCRSGSNRRTTRDHWQRF